MGPPLISICTVAVAADLSDSLGTDEQNQNSAATYSSVITNKLPSKLDAPNVGGSGTVEGHDKKGMPKLQTSNKSKNKQDNLQKETGDLPVVNVC